MKNTLKGFALSALCVAIGGQALATHGALVDDRSTPPRFYPYSPC